jgi:diguanylate cyclase (GGDEF)-like protein
MHKLNSISLRQLLTIPYVLLLIFCAVVIGLLSYLAGRDAVDSLANAVLSETTNRIAQTVDRHISGSEAVLETAFPSGIAAPENIEDDIDMLRTRLWLATSIHRGLNNYAYYGNRDGQFIGLYRHSENDAELRLRLDGSSPRSIFHYAGIDGPLHDPETETRIFEPVERPWYQAGRSTPRQVWTDIYIDFKTAELVGTRAQRIYDKTGKFAGVVATDVPLQQLDAFLDTLQIADNGFAFIVEPDGNLIATSRGPHIRLDGNNKNIRLNAADSADPLVAATYETVRRFNGQYDPALGPAISSFRSEDGAVVQTGYARLKDKAGLDWIVAIAVPRSSYMHQMISSVHRTILLSLLACALFGLVGYFVLNIISRDLHLLTVAARDLGDGKSDSNIPTHRNDEVGELARSFQRLRQKLMTDRLTGIANREAAARKIEERIVRHRRRIDTRPFAILFIDLNGFKDINDKVGHEMGDRVLREVSLRIKNSVKVEDLPARYGGDEFIVVLDSVENRQDALAVRHKLQRVLSFPLRSMHGMGHAAQTLRVGAAIGMAICPDDGHDLDTLLRIADTDMYHQKHPSAVSPWLVS